MHEERRKHGEVLSSQRIPAVPTLQASDFMEPVIRRGYRKNPHLHIELNALFILQEGVDLNGRKVWKVCFESSWQCSSTIPSTKYEYTVNSLPVLASSYVVQRFCPRDYPSVMSMVQESSFVIPSLPYSTLERPCILLRPRYIAIMALATA